MNVEREPIQSSINNLNRQSLPIFSKKIEDNPQVLIDNEIEEKKRLDKLVKKSEKYLNHPKNKTIFNDEEISFLTKRNFDFIPHLLIDSLTPNQIPTVLDETINQDSTPEKICSLCEIIGKGKYGERLPPSLIDYVSQSKDLISDEVINDPSSTIGLSYIFGDRSTILFKEFPLVPNWALSRFWHNLANKDSSSFSNFLTRHLQKKTLNKDFEEKSLDYILNHLTLESIKLLLKKISSNENNLFNQKLEIILPELVNLKPEVITKITSEFLLKPDSLYYYDLSKTFDFFTNSESVFKKIRKFYNLPKTTEIKVKTLELSDGSFRKETPNYQTPINLCLLEDFIVNRLNENNYLDNVEITSNKKLDHHTKYSFNSLIRIYQEKMPSESDKFLKTVLKIGLEEKIKIESEKHYHPIRFFAKSFFAKKDP